MTDGGRLADTSQRLERQFHNRMPNFAIATWISTPSQYLPTHPKAYSQKENANLGRRFVPGARGL